VAGSLVGIWLFALLSALHQLPGAWAMVAAGLLFLQGPILRPRQWPEMAGVVGVVALVWLASWEPGAIEVAWSPYQKLALLKGNPEKEMGDYRVSVNSSGGYQFMTDLSDAAIRKHPERYTHVLPGLSHYDMPAVLHPAPKKLLIVGAGSGNGVAAAVRHGVPDIVAVDIDPVIIDLGRRYHPEKPYDAKTVRVVNDDARSYFATTPERFDVISFEFLDSHTMTSMTNARLDHYVYTRESFQQARKLLNEGGVLVLLFGYEQPFVADRMDLALKEVFGQEPLKFSMPHEEPTQARSVFVAGDLEAVKQQIDKHKALKDKLPVWDREFPLPLAGTTPVATDDWPYIYLEGPRIPLLYFLLALLLLLLFVRGVWRLQLRDRLLALDRSQTHFFFLGAAFMLLEVQNISKVAVVLGNTWEVNAVIISCILVLILLANCVAAGWPRIPTAPVYVLLCGSCVALYFVDIAQFAFLPYGAKAALVGGLVSLPMLFSGIIFIRSFAAVPRKDLALGANLFGALVGGLLQSVTFITGIKALLLLVAALYLAAWATRPSTAAAAATTARPEPVPAGAPAGVG
jgi:spermidine synthase